jgi:hypothetical protein
MHAQSAVATLVASVTGGGATGVAAGVTIAGAVVTVGAFVATVGDFATAVGGVVVVGGGVVVVVTTGTVFGMANPAIEDLGKFTCATCERVDDP